MFIPNIDTLVATIDIKDFDNSARKILVKLAELKDKAKSLVKENSIEKVNIRIGNMTFQVFPNGSRHHAYILHNDLYEIKLARYRSKSKDNYPVFIKIKSACLWNMGFIKAWDTILKLVNKNIGPIKANKISRMDLCCHTDEIELKESDINKFSGKFRSDEIYRSDRKLSGFTFGSGANKKVFCRIYDKTLEIKQKKQKLWFYDIWKKEGINNEKVWNIEFQIGRKYFKEHNIETVGQAFERIKAIWEYCTQKWIIKKELKNTRMENCPVNAIWEKIQEAFSLLESKSLIKRDKQLDRDADALVPSIIGYLTTYSARKGETDMGDCLMNVINTGLRYLEKARKSTFTIEVEKKMALIQGGY